MLSAMCALYLNTIPHICCPPYFIFDVAVSVSPSFYLCNLMTQKVLLQSCLAG